jgi:ATP-dependent exoDNAse (exonuclease V) alpha subunit
MQVARQLEDQHRQLSELQAGLVSQAQIEYVDDLERAAMKLQRLIDRIQAASYGYAGLFDAVKVKEQQLDGLYQFDRDMLGYADEIAAEVDHVGSAIEAGEGVSQAISDLADAVEQANRTFGHREEVILQESV